VLRVLDVDATAHYEKAHRSAKTEKADGRKASVIGHLQTVGVAAQLVRKRSFRIDPIHRAHSWRCRDSGVEMKV
jgi:hypothetical protein